MDPLTVSAQFAAYTWYTVRHAGRPGAEAAAGRFAREHWPAFLGHAHAGRGRFLIRVGRLGRPKAVAQPS